jgi:DNA-binding NarL/FixJ family response regulator
MGAQGDGRMKVRMLLVDDHALVRSGIRVLLENTPDFEIVGEVGDGRKALQACHELHPDVVLTDVEMSSLNGITAARQIHAELPEVKIIMLSMHDDPTYFSESLKAGASGYVLKGESAADLLAGIRAVVSGERYLSPSFKELAADNSDPLDGPESAGLLSRLTTREREILQLVAEGHSSHEVGRTIFVSTKTVEFHRRNIMLKLGIHTIAGLTRFAIKNGLISLK